MKKFEVRYKVHVANGSSYPDKTMTVSAPDAEEAKERVRQAECQGTDGVPIDNFSFDSVEEVQ